jgi:hypothetical protein
MLTTTGEGSSQPPQASRRWRASSRHNPRMMGARGRGEEDEGVCGPSRSRHIPRDPTPPPTVPKCRGAEAGPHPAPLCGLDRSPPLSLREMRDLPKSKSLFQLECRRLRGVYRFISIVRDELLD